MELLFFIIAIVTIFMYAKRESLLRKKIKNRYKYKTLGFLTMTNVMCDDWYEPYEVNVKDPEFIEFERYRKQEVGKIKILLLVSFISMVFGMTLLYFN